MLQKPQRQSLSKENFIKVIKEKLQFREREEVDCVRLFHGRGKTNPLFQHLCIDYFPPNLLVTTYLELSQSEKSDLIEILNSIDPLKYQNLLLQNRSSKGQAIEILEGEIPEEAFAVENSEKYILNLKNPQNIGFFLDMKKGREWLRKNSLDKSVLNLFSYTCSLSVVALKGGARLVSNIDMNKAVLAIGEKNHLINSVATNAKFIPYDVINSFGNIKRKGPYDIIVIDPPTNQGQSFKVERDYAKIVRRLDEMTSSHGLIMACLNSPFLGSTFLINLFIEHAPNFQLVEKIESSFQDMEVNPEEGLKILIFKKM